jgi:hypothetical protein
MDEDAATGDEMNFNDPVVVLPNDRHTAGGQP